MPLPPCDHDECPPTRCKELFGSAALDKRIRNAVEADFQQWMIQSLTPDRGYMTPIDNVRALILELVAEQVTREHLSQ